MKKNLLTKLMLIAVILCLAIALFACGGKKDNSKNKKEDDTPKQTEETDSEFITKLTSIVGKADSLVKTIQSIKADSTVGVEAGIGIGVTMKEDEYNGKIFAKGNLKASNPELQVGFQFKGKDDNALKDYFSLGYQNKKLYLLEGLNLINSTATSSNKIAMDISAISDTLVDANAAVIFKYLADVTQGEGLQNLDLAGMIKDLTEDETMASLIGSLGDLIQITENSSGATITLTTETLSTVLDLIPSFLGGFNDITGTLDTILDYFNITVGTLTGTDDNTKLTYALIKKSYLPTISIKAGYGNNTINALSVDINFSALQLDLALDVDLKTLSTTSTVSMDFSGYTAQDLSAKVGLELGNGYTAELTCEAYTSNAFAQDGNPMAAVKLAVKNGDNAFKNGFATFDGKDVFVDVSAVATELGLAGYQTAYKWSVPTPTPKQGETPDTTTNTVIKYINKYAKMTYDSHWNDPKTPETPEKEEEESSFDVWSFAYGIIAMITKSEAEAPKTIDEAAVVKLIRDELGQYTLFIDENDKSLSDIVDNLKTIYEANKNLLTGSLNKPTDTSYVAGIQLIASNYNAETAVDALTFVSKFIKIANVTSTGKVLNGTKDNTGNPYELGETATAITPALLVDWVNWLFGMNYNKAAAEEVKEGEDYVWWDFCDVTMIKGLTGYTVADIFNTHGLYAGAGTVKNGGLQGYVVLADTKDCAKTYAKLSGEIGFVAQNTNNRIVAEATTAEYNTNGILITDEIGEEGGDAEAYVTVNAAYSPDYPVTDLAYGAIIALINAGK